MKEVRIIKIGYVKKEIEDAETLLTDLVNEGWVIVAGGSFSFGADYHDGFVVLQREAAG